MSSTYAHDQDPSSLPSAILSRLNTDYKPESQPEGPDPCVDSHSEASQHLIHSPTETSPLLNHPLVPRVEEGIENASADNASTVTMFWEELAVLTKYTMPVWGTQLLQYSIVVVSVVAIGHISTIALASISLGSMTASVSGYSIIQGLTSALDTVLPSAWTSDQPQLVGLWTQRMTVVVFVSLAPISLIWLNAESILLSLNQEPEVAHLAGIYLRWASLGLPAYAFNCISRRYFQSQGLFAVPTHIFFVAAPTNALLTWLLVWGPSPIRLGFIGAPIATALSFNLISIMSICYGIFLAPKTAWYPLSSHMFKGLGVLVQLGLSGVGQTASEWWAWESMALAASQLGPTALASQSVLFVSESSAFQAQFGLGLATSVRIGNLLGEKNARRAGVASNTSIIMAVMFGCLSCAMFIGFRHSWPYLFNDDPEVVKLVASISPIMGLFVVFDGWNSVTGGILRATGTQFWGALLNLSGYYAFGIPFGVYLAFMWHLGLLGIWTGMTFSAMYISVSGTWICLRTDWNKEVTKVTQRLKEADQARREAEERE